MSAKVDNLIRRFGSAENVLEWSWDTKTDLLSTFDLLDEEYAELKRLAGEPS